MRLHNPFLALSISNRSVLLLSLLALAPGPLTPAQAAPQPPAKKKAGAKKPDKPSADTATPKPTPAEQEQFVNLSMQVTLALSGAQSAIKAITDPASAITANVAQVSADDDQLARFDNLIAAVEVYVKNNPASDSKISELMQKLKDAQTNIETMQKLFDKGLPDDKPVEGFTAAREGYAALKKSKEDLNNALKSAPKKLPDAISNIPAAEQQFCVKVSALADPLTNLPTSAARGRLSDTLKNHLPNLTDAVRLRYAGNAKLVKLNDAMHLKGVPGTETALEDTTKALHKLSTTLRDTLARLDAEFARLTSDALAESKTSKDRLNEVLAEPRQFAEAAHAQAKVDVPLTSDLDIIIKAAKTLLADGSPVTKPDYPAKYLPPGNFVQDLQNQLDGLRIAKEQLNVLATELNYAHPFDITLWEADQIPLFYFDDVARLIRVINPDAKQVGDTSAQQAAQTARVTLDTASQSLQNARAKVEDARAILAKRTEELRQLRLGNAQKSGDSDTKARTAQKKADETAAALRSAQQRHDVLQAEATRAKAEEDAAQKDYDVAKADSSTDAGTLTRRQARVAATRSRADDAKERVDVAQASVTKAISENDAAQADLKTATGQSATSTTDLNSQLTALQTQLETALTNEQDAESKVREATTNAFLAAQAENAAFAFARDNAPFWMAVPTPMQLKDDDPAVSTDPVRRVMLFAFPNSRTLFIRGSSSDVAQVKEMIAQFDQPQAQAEMTVYTMEIASQSNRVGVTKAMEAMRQIEEELSIHQTQVDTALTYLRQLINEEVEKCCGSDSEEVENYKKFYDPCVLLRMGYYPANFKADQDKYKPVSSTTTTPAETPAGLDLVPKHPDPSGEDKPQANAKNAELYLPLFLPRPTGTATLAEALIVLALANPESRNRVIAKFILNIGSRIKAEVDALPTVRQSALDNLDNYEKEVVKPQNSQQPQDPRSVQTFPNFLRLFQNMETTVPPQKKIETAQQALTNLKESETKKEDTVAPLQKAQKALKGLKKKTPGTELLREDTLKALTTTSPATPCKDSADVTAFQQEIIGELKDNAISGIIIQLKQLYHQDTYFESKMKALDDQLSQLTQEAAASLDVILAADAKRKEALAAQQDAQTAANIAAQEDAKAQPVALAILTAQAATKKAEDKAIQAANAANIVKYAQLAQAEADAKANAAKNALTDANSQAEYARNAHTQPHPPDQEKSLEKILVQKQMDVVTATNNLTKANQAKTEADTALTKATENQNAANKDAEDANKQAVDAEDAAAKLAAQAASEADKKMTEARKNVTKAAAMMKAKPSNHNKIANDDAKNLLEKATDTHDRAQTASDALIAANQTAISANLDLQSRLLQLADDPKWSEQQAQARKLENTRKDYIQKRFVLLDRLLFPTTFALSTMEVKLDTIQSEFALFKINLQDTQSTYGKVWTYLKESPQNLKDYAAKLAPIQVSKQSKGANSPTQNMGQILPDIALVLQNLMNLRTSISYSSQPVNPLAVFSKLSVAKLITETRGETRADWYQKRHAARARTNETLKRFILAVDEDIRGQYVNPLLKRLQTRLLKADLQVGIVQKTSILASNRLIARVDPKASASLALGAEQNILQESLQLAQIVASATKVGAGAAATSGATSANAALSVLQSLNGLPKDAQPGVYGITTGNVFQVTPIFDPTGQAMHFQFDYVAANQIREPSGQTNPQIPRIERHSINTEVQLSNYQLRSVSSFLSNSQIGRPTRYSGGIPILKDIPFINQIPLIGWFTRSGGRAALVQQNVVLAHTSMYPTIQDVINSLVRPSGRPEADFTLPTPPDKTSQ